MLYVRKIELYRANVVKVVCVFSLECQPYCLPLISNIYHQSLSASDLQYTNNVETLFFVRLPADRRLRAAINSSFFRRCSALRRRARRRRRRVAINITLGS